MTSTSTLFWVISRAAGITAMVLASAAVGYGLVMGGRLIRGQGPDRRIIHEILSLSTMVAIAVHGLALLGDTFVKTSLAAITIPLVDSYQRLATSIGIIAGWGMVVLGLSYYVRKRIGIARWRLIHRFTALTWALGLIHTFAEGTDTSKLWLIALIALTAAPAAGLLALRLAGRALPHPRAIAAGARR